MAVSSALSLPSAPHGLISSRELPEHSPCLSWRGPGGLGAPRCLVLHHRTWAATPSPRSPARAGEVVVSSLIRDKLHTSGSRECDA